MTPVWALVIGATIVGSGIAVVYAVIGIYAVVLDASRKARGTPSVVVVARAERLRDAVIRYGTIPYLVTVPCSIAYLVAYTLTPEMGGVRVVVGPVIILGVLHTAHSMWVDFKDRRNKRKRGTRVLGVVRTTAAGLIVVPVRAKG